MILCIIRVPDSKRVRMTANTSVMMPETRRNGAERMIVNAFLSAIGVAITATPHELKVRLAPGGGVAPTANRPPP